MSKKSEWYWVLKKEASAKWAKINDKFEVNEQTGSRKLTSVGCMNRFGTRDEERISKKESDKRSFNTKSNHIEARERHNYDRLEAGMTNSQIARILNSR